MQKKKTTCVCEKSAIHRFLVALVWLLLGVLLGVVASQRIDIDMDKLKAAITNTSAAQSCYAKLNLLDTKKTQSECIACCKEGNVCETVDCIKKMDALKKESNEYQQDKVDREENLQDLNDEMMGSSGEEGKDFLENLSAESESRQLEYIDQITANNSISDVNVVEEVIGGGGEDEISPAEENTQQASQKIFYSEEECEASGCQNCKLKNSSEDDSKNTSGESGDEATSSSSSSSGGSNSSTTSSSGGSDNSPAADGDDSKSPLREVEAGSGNVSFENYLKNGETCKSNSECISAKCVGGVCKSEDYGR